MAPILWMDFPVQVVLLVPISGPIDSVVDRHGFIGSAKGRL